MRRPERTRTRTRTRARTTLLVKLDSMIALVSFQFHHSAVAAASLISTILQQQHQRRRCGTRRPSAVQNAKMKAGAGADADADADSVYFCCSKLMLPLASASAS